MLKNLWSICFWENLKSSRSVFTELRLLHCWSSLSFSNAWWRDIRSSIRASSSFNYYKRMTYPPSPTFLISRNLDNFPPVHFIRPTHSSISHKKVMLLLKLQWVQKHFFANTRFIYLLATTIYPKDFDVRVLGREDIFPKILQTMIFLLVTSFLTNWKINLLNKRNEDKAEKKKQFNSEV